MTNFTLGFDDNLGLPEDFAEKTHLKLKSYHDLHLMINDFAKGELHCAFLPAGTLPFIKGQYELIAQATYGVERTHQLTSCLASAKYQALPAMSAIHFGRINPFCTTSFWGLLIYLMDKTSFGTTLHFTEVAGFHDLLIQTATQTVDAAMIWDALFSTYPREVGKVSVLDKITKLPTPVIIAQVKLPAYLIQQLTDFKFPMNNGFFNGFAKVDTKNINHFIAQIELCRDHFKCR